MSGGYFYLVHFPDGTEAVYNIIGTVVEPGTEILPSWIVTKIELYGDEINGVPVSFEAWVEPKPPEEPIVVAMHP